MQNLEAYQNLELQKQLAKMQIIGTFQNYLKKVVSLSMAQQVILQKAGISSNQFEGLSSSPNPLLQPTYVDPATIFGPSLALLNTSADHSESRSLKTNIGHSIPKAGLNHPRLSSKPHHRCHSPSRGHFVSSPVHQNTQSFSHANNSYELPPLPMKKKFEPFDEEDLNDFFQKKVSNASTNYSVNLQEDEIDTGKRIRLEKEIHADNPSQASLKGRKRTKVICGHPWKTHHAKGLCKNCYETFGKTRKPWKCEHQAHFAKGYCKKCYLRLRQKISVKDIFPFAIEEIRKRAEKKKDNEDDTLSPVDMEIAPTNVKEEAI